MCDDLCSQPCCSVSTVASSGTNALVIDIFCNCAAMVSATVATAANVFVEDGVEIVANAANVFVEDSVDIVAPADVLLFRLLQLNCCSCILIAVVSENYPPSLLL